MTSTGAPGRLWLRDLVAPGAVEYVLLLQHNAVSWLRIAGRRRVSEILREAVPGGDLPAVQSFLQSLPGRPGFYGQPFSILLQNKRSFTYVHFFHRSDSGRFAQKLRFLEDGFTEFSQEVRPSGGKHLFIGQGIDRNFLGGLRETIDAAGLPVTGIESLGVRLARTAPLSPAPSLHLVALPGGNVLFLGSDGQSGVAIGDIPRGADGAASAASRLSRTIFGPEAKPKIYSFGIERGKPGAKQAPHSPARLLAGNATNRGYSTSSSRRAVVVQRASSASKLLALITGSAALLISLVVAGLRVAGQPEGVRIDEYLHACRNRERLVALADSLTGEIAVREASAPPHRAASPWVALFCQERVPDLYLNRLEIVYSPSGAFRIQTTGTAARETPIFRFLEMLRRSDAAWELHTIVPAVVMTEGRPDSLQNFTIRLERGTHAH